MRLIPRWFTALSLLMTVVPTLLFVALAAAGAGDGVAGDVAAWGLAVAFGSLSVSAVSALARRRRVREPRVDPDGVRVFEAPAATVWPLLLAWAAALVVAVAWAVQFAVDPDAITARGVTAVTILAVIGTLPDAVRLATGRLHRWRLEIGPQHLRYRGYRSDATWSWAQVHGAAIQQRKPAGVRIDVKGAGEDPVVPITAFAVPAEQLVDEIRTAVAQARGRSSRPA